MQIKTSSKGGDRTSQSASIKFNLILLLLFMSLLGVLTGNLELSLLSAVASTVFILLLWGRVNSEILVATCGMQWLQVALPLIYAGIHGNSLELMYGVPQMEMAIQLSLVGIVALAFGIRVAWSGVNAVPQKKVIEEIAGMDLKRLLVVWLVSTAISGIVALVASRLTGLTQLMYQLSNVKWVFFYILAFTVLTRNSGFGLLTFATVFELINGFLGYFASFKEVFFMLAIVGAGASIRLRPKNIMLIVVSISFVVYASVMWTAVKGPYREYQLIYGSEASAIDRAGRFIDLIAAVTPTEFDAAAEKLVYRISYTEYFARALNHVPNVRPHENGKLWGGAIIHVFMPRLLFPDKESLDDSERVRAYTGTNVAGAESMTSIGIGYMGESYIDFGPYLMFVPIFCLGILYGLVYRFFARSSNLKIVGIAVATSVLFPSLQGFATSNIKIVGSLITTCVVMIPVCYVVFPRVFRWVCHDENR